MKPFLLASMLFATAALAAPRGCPFAAFWKAHRYPPEAMTHETLEKLRVAALAGDREARNELLRRLVAPMAQSIHRALTDRPQAADKLDVLQEALLSVDQSLGTATPGRSLAAWAWGVAANKCVDRIRKRQVLDKYFPESLGPGHDKVDRSLSEGAKRAYERYLADLRDEVRDWLPDVPSSFVDMFLAYELDGVPQKDLAAASSVSASTLSIRFTAIRKLLRERMRGEDVPPGFFP